MQSLSPDFQAGGPFCGQLHLARLIAQPARPIGCTAPNGQTHQASFGRINDYIVAI